MELLGNVGEMQDEKGVQWNKVHYGRNWCQSVLRRGLREEKPTEQNGGGRWHSQTDDHQEQAEILMHDICGLVSNFNLLGVRARLECGDYYLPYMR